MTKYDYTEFKKHYEEQDGKILRIAKAIGKPRTTVRSWIDKMEATDVVVSGLNAEVKRLRQANENLLYLHLMSEAGQGTDIEGICEEMGINFSKVQQEVEDELSEQKEAEAKEESEHSMELLVKATEAYTGKPYNKVDAYLLEKELNIKGNAIQKFLRDGSALPKTVVKTLQEN